MLRYLFCKTKKMPQLAFAFVITYPLLTCAVKVSTLMLYRRIFTMGVKSFRIGWWSNLIYVSCYTVAILVTILTLCKPIRNFWSLAPQLEACPHETEVPDIVFGVLNGLGDLFILSLPMPVVWRLQMRRSNKIAVCGMFLLGSL